MSEEQARAVSGDAIAFNENITLHPGTPLPHYNRGVIKAYAAEGTGSVSSNLFVLVCDPQYIPRSNISNVYTAFAAQNIARLVNAGKVIWPPDQAERFCLIYEQIAGKPIVEKDDGHATLAVRHDFVVNNILRPLTNVLSEFYENGFIHGAIHPGNMFASQNGGDYENIVLGECLSHPCGSQTPPFYETIARAQTWNIAKGQGSYADDMYSLGATLAVFLRSQDPLAGMDEDQILQTKIDRGSYTALLGDERLNGAVIEMLRGLLHDDASERWTLTELEAWLDGRRLSPKQNMKRAKASRPLEIDDIPCFTAVDLAKALVKNPQETIRMVEGGEIEQWLVRAMGKKMLHNRYEIAVDSVEEQGKSGGAYAERLTSFLCTALDPEGPIRFGPLRLLPEGIGNAMVASVLQKKSLQAYGDMISSRAVSYWLDQQDTGSSEISMLISKFDNCRSYLRQTNVGYGIERCIYFLSPEAPCLSEPFRKYYIRTPEGFLYALDDLLSKGAAPKLPIDRHVAAFISVRDGSLIDSYLNDLNSRNEDMVLMGTIRTLAIIQKKAKLSNFPHIFNWLEKISEPLYGRFHDRELQKKIRHKIADAKSKGNIAEFATYLGDPGVLEKDYNNFMHAQREYEAFYREKEHLKAQINSNHRFGYATGQDIAALCSTVLSGLAILVMGIIQLTGKGF